MLKLLTSNRFILPIGFMILNFVLKFIFIDYGHISGDEPFTIFWAQAGLDGFAEMLEHENNPPLFFLIMHVWVKLFGVGVTAVRMVPLIFSCLTVPFIFLIGKRFFNLKTAIITATLFTFSSYGMYFAHETRVYSLFGLLTAISMYSFLSLHHESSSKKHFIIFILANSLLIYAHFFGFFVFAIQGICSIGIKEFRTNWKKIWIGFVIAGLTYLPYLPTFLSRFSASSNGTWVEEPNLKSLYNMVWSFSNEPVNTVFFILVLVSAFILWLKRKTIISPFSKAILIWFWFPYIIMFAVSFILPMFIDRYLTHVVLGFYLMVALALNTFNFNKWLNVGIPLLGCVLMIATVDLKNGHLPNRKDMMTEIKAYKDEKTAVVLCPPWRDLEFSYYYNVDIFKNYKKNRKLLHAENVFPVFNITELSDSVLNGKYDKLIYLDSWSALTDKEGKVQKAIQSNYKWVISNESFKGYKLHYYKK